MMNRKEILKITDLCKAFGTYKVLDNLNLTVSKGSVYGFIGKNGAGKTTTMKCILGLLPIDKGEIYVCGEKVQIGETKTNKYIGYLPDVPSFYTFMTAREYLKLCGDITGMKKNDINKRIIELLDLVGLKDDKKKIGGYSRGMKQRLGFAQALLNQPKLLICDEPTSALDPIGRKEILDILKKIKEKTTVIFSTHVLTDVESVCDHVGILHEGKIILSGALEKLKKEHCSNEYLIKLSTKEEWDIVTNFNSLKLYPHRFDMDKLELYIQSNNIKEVGKIVIEELKTNSILPLRLEIIEPSLEDLFLEVVKK